MKKILILLAALAIAAPAFGAGIDLSANHTCPGVAGGNSDGGVLNCADLAANAKLVSIYASFVTAENIGDLSNLDGTVRVTIGAGDWNTTGAFWDGSPGKCLDSNSGSVKFVGAKPTNGDPCGNIATVRECFPDGSAQTTVIVDPQNMDLFFTVYKAGSTAVTTAQRLFGFEIRYDPVFATEAGFFTCGTCAGPVCWHVLEARPGSFGGSPTTPLSTATGFSAQVGPEASYNGGTCAPVSTKARTWGQLKTLYR